MASTRPQPPPAARRHYQVSALLAGRAAREAVKSAPAGTLAVARTIATHQAAAATLAASAVAQMLLEQEIEVAADGLLNSLAFTTSLETFSAMLDAATEDSLARLAESLVQDSGRAAETVAVAVRKDVYHVRYVTPPCCGRCAVLAGRAYRWSSGFLRHPNCDCVMVPTTVAAPFAQTADRLAEQGAVRGLSKADQKAIDDGASLDQVVNVRRRAAGLSQSGQALSRAGKPTPAGIYRIASTRAEAVELLARFGYIT